MTASGPAAASSVAAPDQVEALAGQDRVLIEAVKEKADG